MNKDTYIIIPVYNEAGVIADVIAEVKKRFSNVVCVDDGSADDSSKIIEKTQATLIKHPINLGAGAATQTGIEYALMDESAKYFVTFDGDGQHHIKDALTMKKYMQDHSLDVVFGSRFLGKIENISLLKRVFLGVAKLFSRLDTGVALTDPHIGLRIFNRKFAENLNITMPDFSHASEVVHRIKQGNYAYGEVPVTVTYSDYTKSKGQPMLNSVNIVFDLLLNRISKS